MSLEITPEILASKVIVSGIHLHLTDALKSAAETKATRLLRRSDEIIRIRIDIEHDKTRGTNDQFVAKGHIEIGGPDLLASVTSDDAYKSLDLLAEKLDRLLHRRHSESKEKRNHPHAVELDSELPKA